RAFPHAPSGAAEACLTGGHRGGDDAVSRSREALGAPGGGAEILWIPAGGVCESPLGGWFRFAGHLARRGPGGFPAADRPESGEPGSDDPAAGENKRTVRVRNVGRLARRQVVRAGGPLR